MDNSGWGWDVLESDEAESGSGSIYAGKGRKGPDGRITLTLNLRRLHQLRKFIEACIASPGSFTDKRALVLISEDIRLAVAESKKLQARLELLRKHGLSDA